MTECGIVEIRERLPDLLHGSLGAADAERIRAHLATCDDCRAELALLESAREYFVASSPEPDIGRIVAALPRPLATKPALHDSLMRRTVAPGAAVTRRRLSLPPSVNGRGTGWLRRTSVGVALAAALLLAAVGLWSSGDEPGSEVTRSAYTAAPDDEGLSFAGGVSDLSDEALI